MNDKGKIVAVFSATITLREGDDPEAEEPTIAKLETLVEDTLADETGLDVNVSATRTDR